MIGYKLATFVGMSGKRMWMVVSVEGNILYLVTDFRREALKVVMELNRLYRLLQYAHKELREKDELIEIVATGTLS